MEGLADPDRDSRGHYNGNFRRFNIEKRFQNLKNLKNQCSSFTCGRRIIDVEFFGKEFDKGCRKCGGQILWKNLVDETSYGLCSLLHFKCHECLHVTKLYSSGSTTLGIQRGSSNNRMRPFTVNVKAALAMIHAGVGATHVNAIFVTLGLPPLNPKTLKRRERDIGPVLEKTAKMSCVKYSEEERRCTLEDVCESGDNLNGERMSFDQALEFLEVDHIDDDTAQHSELSDGIQHQIPQQNSSSNGEGTATCHRNQDTTDSAAIAIPIEEAMDQTPSSEPNEERTIIDITVSQDAAWSKRGKAMNSLSGVGHVVGVKTRKCLNFGTRKKKCKRCLYYQKLKKPVPSHDCRLNWTHTARSMEADIAVQLHKEAVEQSVRYADVIGDEDSSAIKQIREKVNSDVKKFSDITHIKRSLTNRLQELSKTHPVLTEKVRVSFVKNFTYAVYQNKNKGTHELHNALSSIVPHMYGDHTSCGQWCGDLTKSQYRHSNLPHGKDLTDSRLKESLQSLMDPFLQNPSKLMTSGDSQPNESLNNVIFSKAPKVRNYNLSESFDFRCAAGVLQFNEGKGYIRTVIEDSNLSPRKETIDYTAKEERKRAYNKKYKSERVHKKRRVELKKIRKQKEITSSVKLGTRYKTDCCLDEDELDTTEIPDPPKPRVINCKPSETQTIFVDLETTKLGYGAEITQIGACVDQSHTFSKYIIPEDQISKFASNLTGLEVKIENGTKLLYKNGVKVDAVDPVQGLQSFVQWLSSVRVDDCMQILCAHNGGKFDFPIFLQCLYKHGMLENLKSTVCGVVDSIPILQSVYQGQKSYALANIYASVCSDPFENHDALNDVKALYKVFALLRVPPSIILDGAVHVDTAVDTNLDNIQLRKKVNVLQQKLDEGGNGSVLSDRIARKMCKAGITFSSLMLAYTRNHDHGISAILSEKIDGKPRVTNRKRIIDTLTNVFAEKCKA